MRPIMFIMMRFAALFLTLLVAATVGHSQTATYDPATQKITVTLGSPGIDGADVGVYATPIYGPPMSLSGDIYSQFVGQGQTSVVLSPTFPAGETYGIGVRYRWNNYPGIQYTLTTPTVLPAPSNDGPTSPVVLPVTAVFQPVNGTFLGSTSSDPNGSFGTGCAQTYQGSGHDVFYKFTATGSTAHVRMEMPGLNATSLFGVEVRPGSGGAPLACFQGSAGIAEGDVTGLTVGAEYTLVAAVKYKTTTPVYPFTIGVTDPNAIKVSPKMFLDGPFVSGTNLMNDGLRSAGLIPIQEPYTAAGYTHVGGGGGERRSAASTTVTGPNAIVDWVVVELRETGFFQVLRSRSALLQRDGDVVDVDGTSPVGFVGAAPPFLCVSVRHRNHLGVMTASFIGPLSTTSTVVDFTTTATAVWGTDARKTNGTKQTLWSGNVVFDANIKYTGSSNDRDPILTAVGSTTPNNTLSGYRKEDTNMDGVVKYTGSANDRDGILTVVGSTTPNNVKVQQLP